MTPSRLRPASRPASTGPARSAVPAVATIAAASAASTAPAAIRRAVIGLLPAVAVSIAAAGLTLSPPARAELAVGEAAPTFAIEAALGGEPFRFDLAEALKKGPVVLYFYPKAFTTGCTLEANAFAEAMGDYQALGATVIGVSGDDIDTLRRFSVAECRGKFAVGADHDRSVMKAYKATMPLVDSYAKRISYVISPDAKIVFAYESGSYEQHVPRTLAAVKALKPEAR